MSYSYGVRNQHSAESDLAQQLEELAVNGYTVLADVLSEAQLQYGRTSLDRLLALQESEFGRERLSAIGEANTVRCPLAYDDFFLQLAAEPRVTALIQQAIGGGYITLHLQNGIVNTPDGRHVQSAWHRDLPYQEFTSSRPIAVGALYCIDEFTVENGCTHVLPHSHRLERIPSEQFVARHELPIEAKAGSAIVFDAMLFHRAGINSSSRIRRGVNNVFTIPLIKQQIDLSEFLKQKKIADPVLRKLFALDDGTPISVDDFREKRWSASDAGKTTRKATLVRSG